MLTEEVDISNYLGVNIKKNQMGHSNYRNWIWWKKYSTMLDLFCLRISSQEIRPLKKITA